MRSVLDSQVGFVITAELRATLEQLAEQEQRTLSQMIRILLTEALDARS